MKQFLSGLFALFWASAAFAQGGFVGLAPVAPQPQAYMIAGYSNIPWQYLAQSTSAYRVSKKVYRSPNYPVGPCRLGYTNFYSTNAQPQENDPSANFVLLGARMVVGGASVTSAWTNLGGAAGVSIAPGAGSTGGSGWSDPIFVTMPPNTQYAVYTYDNPGASNQFLDNFTANASLGEFVNYSGSSLTGVYAGTTQPGTRYTGPNQGLSPQVICQGGNGSPVYEVFGDSIQTEQGGVYAVGDVDGVLGTVCRIMNDTLNGTIPRWACATSNVPGQAAGQIINAASIQRRLWFFNNIPNQTGNPPFSHIGIAWGTNDVNAASSAANAESAINTMLGVIRTAWPGQRLNYFGWPSRDSCGPTGSTTDNYWCSPNGAITPAVNFVYPSGIGPTVLNCIAASSAYKAYVSNGFTTCSGITNPPDNFISLGQAFDNSSNGGTAGVYRTDMASSNIGTLYATVSIGGLSIQMTGPPPKLGQALVLDPGCGTGSNGSVVCTGSPTGESFKVVWIQAGISSALPYTIGLIGCANGGTFTSAHAAGTIVATTPSCEGIHPSGDISAAVADIWAPTKTQPGSVLN